MRAKKNEPLSNLRAKTVRVMNKGASVTLATPTTLVEEIIPQQKRKCTSDSGKDKADSCSSSVWDDIGVVMARAQETFTTEEMKVFLGTSPSEVVGRHLHKLI